MQSAVYKILVTVTIAVFSLSSCSRIKDYFIVKKAVGKEMIFPDSLVKVTGPELQKGEKYTLVSFVNAKECAKCYAATLPIWNAVLETSRADVQTVFVFEQATEQLQASIDSSNSHTVFADFKCLFRKENRYLQNDIKYDTFLVDSTNTIVLRGNPLFGENILRMYLNVISGRND